MLSSQLYKLLRFWQRFENGFKNVNEIYFLMYGYHLFMHKKDVSSDLYEDWVDDFFDFISIKLKDLFYPHEELRNIHFGMIIQEYIADEKERIDLFYKILDEYVDKKVNC